MSPCKLSKVVSLPLAQQCLFCRHPVVKHIPHSSATARLKVLVNRLCYKGITSLNGIYT